MRTAFLTTTLLVVPGIASAQSASETGNACDRLVGALQQNDTQELSITLEQARQYRENDNARACETALRQLENGPSQSDTAANRAGDTASEQERQENSEITVEGGAPQIRVQQAAPDVRVQQQQPSVTVDRGQPEIAIHQPAPTVNVEIPRPQITLRMPEPDVSVSTPEPQVSVDQAEPEFQVVRPSQEDRQSQVQTGSGGAPEPVVRYESEEPQVDVTQTGEVQVRMERREDERQAAADQAMGAQDQERSTSVDTANRAGQEADDQSGQETAAQQDASEQNQGQVTQQTASSQSDQAMSQPQEDAGADQFSVADLKGMELMDSEGQSSIGTIEMVILDSDDRPFVIVDRGDGQAAVLVSVTRSQGDHLVLRNGMAESRLPNWSQDDLDSQGVRELEESQEVRIQAAS